MLPQMKGESLHYEQFCKYLGVNIDSKLKFDRHIDVITKKVSRATGILYKIRTLLPMKARLNYYYSLIYPYLSYCVIVWGGTYESTLKNLVIQHKKLIRIIADAPHLSHTTQIFRSLRLLKFKDIYNYHSVNTRNRQNLVPSFHRLSASQHAVSFKGPHLWNALPHSLKSIDSLPCFKRHLRDYFLSLYV